MPRTFTQERIFNQLKELIPIAEDHGLLDAVAYLNTFVIHAPYQVNFELLIYDEYSPKDNENGSIV